MSEKSEKFIVAVSGGVDSVALLDALAKGRFSELAPNYQPPKDLGVPRRKNEQGMDSRLRGNDSGVELIVAHFDHGIRADSEEDAKFVKSLADEHGLQFELGHGKLGLDASEARAREVRYEFLRQCCKTYKTSAIITAHHQDDLIETAVINLLRGTGWRGLAPMMELQNSLLCHSQLDWGSSKDMDPRIKSEDDGFIVLRPLLATSKQELVNYAKRHSLTWREDSTNINQDFLRNYVRLTLLPAALKADPLFSEKMLELIKATRSLKGDIEVELGGILQNAKCKANNSAASNYQVPRYQLIMWPSLVAREVIYSVLVSLNLDWHPERVQVERVLIFVKTAKVGKQMQVSKHLLVEMNQDSASFQFTP